jgi:hypothetical protein
MLFTSVVLFVLTPKLTTYFSEIMASPAMHHKCKCNHNHHAHSDIGKNNQEHFEYVAMICSYGFEGRCSDAGLSNVAATIFDTPWIRDLTTQISNELHEQVDWIGFRRSTPDDTGERATKMLDYACGNGVVSRVSPVPV